jgi:6-phosphofructokinase 2
MPDKIVTVTINPSLDKFTSIGRVVPNDKLRCNSPVYQAGGGGINVSRAIHRLGGSSKAIFTCGGINGQALKSIVEEKSIDHLALSIQDATRENFTVFEDQANQAFRFVMPGPDLIESEWEAVLDSLAKLDPKPDYIVASGSLPSGVPDNFYLHVAEIAHMMHSRLIIDTSGMPLQLVIEEGVFLLKPNIRELSELADVEIEDEDQEIEVAKSIIRSGGTEVMIVSLGAGGALLVTKDTVEQLRTPTVPIRSKLGAGDSMVAGIALSLAKGWSMREATLYGNAAGAATVMTHGTQLCTKEDTDRLYERLVRSEN